MPDGFLPQHRRPERHAAWWVAALLLLTATCGCKSTLDASALRDDPLPKIDSIQGPQERALLAASWRRRVLQQKSGEADEDSTLKPIEGLDQYNAAEELYKQERYDQAEAAFKKVAKKFKKSPIREDALFMRAEAAYQQKLYAKAHDGYTELLNDYPSTRHLDTVSVRLFGIARTWLKFPEAAKMGEIQQVDLKQPGKRLPAEEDIKTSSTWPIVPNLTDKTRPLFDTEGNALSALRSIWMHDPTGPLADDALMLTASHHARKGNFLEADQYFSMLREQYPNSPHTQAAFVLGSHVKLMSYQGASYDGRTLEESDQLKQSTLRLYPGLPEKERIEQELQGIEEARAARDWANVILYLRKRRFKAAAVYAQLLIDDHPNSSYAEKARDVLAHLGPEYRMGNRPAKTPGLLPAGDSAAKPLSGAGEPDEIDTPGRAKL